ncbi:Pentatricopeptide repeat-containing protein [Sesamum alatum]|uniref:Pentatricopeptide repeat-containing protein n=1 Tax=Sesamum alatum TaxID=300844 RepID=A0AAE2CJK4_9LAMI|nr:Pentatricopeptide repeat-containing protein [Sesamum alatum]
MKRRGIWPDEFTFAPLLKACANLRDLCLGLEVYKEVIVLGFERFGAIRVGALELYVNCERMGEAKRVFDEMSHRDVIVWNLMIRGFCRNGDVETGFTCCVHAGLLQRGRDLFASMVMDHHIQPKLEHYGCMIDLLGRSGCVREAYEFIQTMPMKPNAALWGALLSACRTIGDKELAEHALKELINLEPWNSGNYVLLSNIYAERGNWSGVEEVRTLMKENCADKIVGQSMIG